MDTEIQEKIRWWEAFLRQAKENREEALEKRRPQSELDEKQRVIDQAESKLRDLRNRRS